MNSATFIFVFFCSPNLVLWSGKNTNNLTSRNVCAWSTHLKIVFLIKKIKYQQILLEMLFIVAPLCRNYTFDVILILSLFLDSKSSKSKVSNDFSDDCFIRKLSFFSCGTISFWRADTGISRHKHSSVPAKYAITTSPRTVRNWKWLQIFYFAVHKLYIWETSHFNVSCYVFMHTFLRSRSCLILSISLWEIILKNWWEIIVGKDWFIVYVNLAEVYDFSYNLQPFLLKTKLFR